MISLDFIAQLHCPYCGSSLRLESPQAPSAGGVEYGVLRCACYRYPVVAGIVILRQRAGVQGSADPVAAHIEAGDHPRALHHQFYLDTPIEHSRSLWQSAAKRLGLGADQSKVRVPEEPATLRAALEQHRPPGYAQYLLHRYANNSFLSAIPLLLLLDRLREAPAAPLRVLDLNCGIGHASYLAQTLLPGVSAVATDHDFVNLFVARRYMIPGTPCLCLDAEVPLPFADGYFDAAVCMDGLHYVRSKRALVAELERSVKETGIWLFPHLHNALATNVSPGTPLAPADYQNCFDGIPARLLDEGEVFQTFLSSRRLELAVERKTEDLNRAPVFSAVASRRDDVLQPHDFTRAWPRPGTSRLAINPIYQQREEAGAIHLRMAWPNPTLERECAPVKQFLPQEFRLDAALWKRVQGGVRPEDAAEVTALMQSFVLVPLPENYV